MATRRVQPKHVPEPDPVEIEEDFYEAQPFGSLDNEYASVALRFDHLQDLEGKTVLNKTFSSETAVEATLALMAYHKRMPTADDVVLLAMGVQVGCAFYVRVSEAIAYLVVDMGAYAEVKDDPEQGNGTDLGTDAVFTARATELVRQAKAKGLPVTALLGWASE